MPPETILTPSVSVMGNTCYVKGVLQPQKLEAPKPGEDTGPLIPISPYLILDIDVRRTALGGFFYYAEYEYTLRGRLPTDVDVQIMVQLQHAHSLVPEKPPRDSDYHEVHTDYATSPPRGNTQMVSNSTFYIFDLQPGRNWLRLAHRLDMNGAEKYLESIILKEGLIIGYQDLRRDPSPGGILQNGPCPHC